MEEEMPVQRLKLLVDTLAVLALTNSIPVLLWIGLGPAAYVAAYLLLIPLFLLINISPMWDSRGFTRLGVLRDGGKLIALFGLVMVPDTALTVWLGFTLLGNGLAVWQYVLHILLWLLACAVLVLNGCIRIFATSVQLGIKWRVLFLLLWWVPVVNLVLLCTICRIVGKEYAFEREKAALNAVRREGTCCATRYPLLLVHGVFFRDRRLFNYWGRVPGELLRNGATVYYGEQNSASSVENAGQELRDRVLRIVEETGCGKVNIIAHSKGGLDARYAVSRLGLGPYVASLTTVNTPHRGCAFADWLLGKAPDRLCAWVSRLYDSAMKRLGDTAPDFNSAVRDLTAARCERFNRETPDVPGVLYQSVGSRMKGWSSTPFPQNLSYLLVRCFDRENDGLVGVESMQWGEFRMVSAPGRRGLSHGDMIDLNRQNIRGFDVREFYVALVKELQARGL